MSMSSVPCRRSSCLSTEFASPRSPRNIGLPLLDCQGESLQCRRQRAAAIRTPQRFATCQPAPSCIDSFRTRQPRSVGHEMTQEDFPTGGDRFPPTRRSVIEAVRSIDAEERERALGVLCAAYWKPVYKYVRLRWNRTSDAAQDLTQGFFVELLERELLDKFDAKKS